MKIEQLLDVVVDDTTVNDWYLCGPQELVETARGVLADRGVDPRAIHDELFFSGPPPEVPIEVGDELGLPLVRFTLEGRTSQVRVPPDGAPILDYALGVRQELPFSCRGGMCTSCRARVLEGAGLNARARARLDGSRAAILNFHRVLPEKRARTLAVEPGMTLTPESFR